MERDAETAELVDEGLAFRLPLFQVGWRVFWFGRAWENDIGDLQIADRAAEVGGIAVEFAAEQERGFTSFVRGAGVAEDCWEGTTLVNHHGEVAHFRNKRPGVVAHDETGKNDEGVHRGDKETPLLEIMDAAFGEVDTIFDFLNAGRLETRLGQLRLELGEFFFLDRQAGIHAVGLLQPAITRLRQEEHG